MTPMIDRKDAARLWFEGLRDQICAAFVAIEDTLVTGVHAELGPGCFERTEWTRPAVNGDETSGLGGGGVMSVMRGRVFEKVGVSVSTVQGQFSDAFRGQIPGTDSDASFWASGISVVAHMRSPHVPAVHMNTRHIVTGKAWFGGGADLTPMFPEAHAGDAADFHAALQGACDAADPAYYQKFKDWCDEYFYLPHRDEPRGLGGIFYDRVNTGDWDKDFAFTQSVGKAFLDCYPKIVRSRMDQPWTEAERQAQLVRRGRYVEFNLLHDRGTKFGLMTGGKTEAILMSLPPEVKWP